MKKTLLTILTLILTVTIGANIAKAIGSLTPSGTAGDATQYTLNDIYTKLTTNTSTSTKSGMFTTPGSVTETFRTLTEIYDAIPGTLSLSNSTTTVPVGINLATTTLTAIDSDLVAGNIATGTSIFGITGTLVTLTSASQWSTNQGFLTWADAVVVCAGTVDGSTGWRLPTVSELLAGISDDWIINNSGSRFAFNNYYWSATEYGGSNAWSAYWIGYVSHGYDDKFAYNHVLCVR